MHCYRKLRRKSPLMLYIIIVFFLYPLIQSLHLVRLIAQEDPYNTDNGINLRRYSNSTKVHPHADYNATYKSNSEQPSDDASLGIKDILGELLQELRRMHQELMDVIRSPLTANKTEAHNLNTEVLQMIKKVNNSGDLPNSRATLGVMVELKDIIYKEMRLLRKFAKNAAPKGVPGRAHINPRKPQPRKVKGKPKAAVKEVKHCLQLKFANPPMAVTALASYPGSGNTWLRHLIQEATGLLTGSLHQDPYLMGAGFPGEKTTDGKVVVVKAHAQPEAVKRCTKAIILLRNPYRSLLADYNRHNRISSNEHTGHAPDALFTEPDWTRRANILGADWYMFYDGWLEFNKPKLVLSYEELKINPKYHVKRIVQFLGLNIPEKNYECMLNNTEGSYHRKPKQVEVNLFNKKQIELVNLYADMIKDKLRKYNVTIDTTVPH